MSEQQINIGVIWPDAEDKPVLRANQFVTQLSPGADGVPEELLLVVGHVAPPLILGTPEEMQAMAAALGAVSSHTLGRFSISRGRLGELITLLSNAAAKWDAAAGGN